jgi:hypothetical protein
MVSLKEINDRLNKAGDDLERLTRRILPVSKGGDVEGRTVKEQLEDTFTPTTTELVTGQDPIPTRKITSRKEGAAPTRSRPGSGGSRGARGTIPTMEVAQVDLREAIETVVNAPEITITSELMDVINDPTMLMTRNGELTRRIGNDLSRQFELQNVLPGKKKRKVSKYQKEFGKQLKLLKKKFPRTAVTKLMKRAHAATRKVMKKK